MKNTVGIRKFFAMADHIESPDRRYIVEKNKPILGRGATKAVYPGRWNNNINVACAVIDVPSKDYAVERQELLREIQLLRELSRMDQSGISCPYIVKYYHAWIHRSGGFLRQNKLIMVFEYCDHGSIWSRIEKFGADKELAKQWAWQILTGLSYLHGRNIIHNDINPKNIFLTGHNYDVRIGDFGSSVRIHNATVPPVATPYYMAPELWMTSDKNMYDEKVDIYSFGLTILFAVTGTQPFEESNMIIFVSLNWKEEPYALSLINCNTTANFIRRSCDRKAKNRYSIERLLSDPYLDSFRYPDSPRQDYAKVCVTLQESKLQCAQSLPELSKQKRKFKKRSNTINSHA